MSKQFFAVVLATAAGVAAMAGSAQAVSFTGSYSENFNSMGTTGTTPPTDWLVYTGASGSNNSTWTTTIPAAGVAAMVQTTGALTAITTPTANNNNGYNAAASAGATSDRVLATAPTTVSGSALQLKLTNNTGNALSDLLISYDTVRYTVASAANELPGYWLFYSLNNTTWTNVASLNPTIATVPNTVGVTPTSGSFSFSAPVANGADFYLRWVDDNAVQSSPDQIIGLNNVSLSASAIPTPAMLPGLIGMGIAALRKRKCAS
jgi:hypothetical protein